MAFVAFVKFLESPGDVITWKRGYISEFPNKTFASFPAVYHRKTDGQDSKRSERVKEKRNTAESPWDVCVFASVLLHQPLPLPWDSVPLHHLENSLEF